jgi:hypothetical protein
MRGLDFELKEWVKQTVLELVDRHRHFLMWEGELVPRIRSTGPNHFIHCLRDRDFFTFLFPFDPFLLSSGLVDDSLRRYVFPFMLPLRLESACVDMILQQ